MSRTSAFAHAADLTQAEDTLEEDPRIYRPYDKNHTVKQKLALDLVDQGVTIDTLYYPYMLRVRYTPPRLLSVVYFDAVFTIAWRHLDELRWMIRDHLVSEVHVFNAHYHYPPPAHTPIIEKILIEPRRIHERRVGTKSPPEKQMLRE